MFTTTEGPTIEPEGRLHAFCHALPDRWHLMGVMLSAAGSLRWFRDALAPGVAFEELVEEAAQAPPGSDGLLFLPYLTGERTPYPDPLARGAFVGLTVHHGRAHLTRAVLEGVAFGMRDSLELMRAAGLAPPTEIRATGGGIRSPLWRQILADVLGAAIVTTSRRRGCRAGRRDARRRRGRVVRHGPGRVPGARADRRDHRALGGRGRLRARVRPVPRALSGARRDLPRHGLIGEHGRAQPTRNSSSITRRLPTASDGGIGTWAPSSTAAANRSAWIVYSLAGSNVSTWVSGWTGDRRRR